MLACSVFILAYTGCSVIKKTLHSHTFASLTNRFIEGMRKYLILAFQILWFLSTKAVTVRSGNIKISVFFLISINATNKYTIHSLKNVHLHAHVTYTH